MGLFNNMKDVKKAIWLYEKHDCSCCGEQSASRQKVVLQYRYDEIGLSRSELQRKIGARQRLDEAERELIGSFADREDIGKFYDLNLLGKCSKCGHREPWSRMRSRWFMPLFNTMIVMSTIALIAAAVTLFTDGSGWMLLPAAGMILLTGGMKLLQKNRRSRRERRIAAMDERYIPFLTEDETVFREIYPDIEVGKLTTVEPSGYYQVTDP